MSATTHGQLRVVRCKATLKLLDEFGYTVAETLLCGPDDKASAERLSALPRLSSKLAPLLPQPERSRHEHPTSRPESGEMAYRDLLALYGPEGDNVEEHARSLAWLNDHGKTFAEIAAIVRVDPAAYFSKPK